MVPERDTNHFDPFAPKKAKTTKKQAKTAANKNLEPSVEYGDAKASSLLMDDMFVSDNT